MKENEKKKNFFCFLCFLFLVLAICLAVIGVLLKSETLLCSAFVLGLIASIPGAGADALQNEAEWCKQHPFEVPDFQNAPIRNLLEESIDEEE